MKTKLLRLTALTILAAAIGICGMGCFCSAFGIPMQFGAVLFVCLACAGTACGLRSLRFGWLVWPGILAAGMALVYFGNLVPRFLSIAAAVWQPWAQAYEWETPQLLLEAAENAPGAALLFLGGLLSFFAGAALARGRTLPALLAALVPIVPCLVVNTTIPDTAYLLADFICAAALLLTASVRRTDHGQGVRLLALVLIPVALYMAVIFRCNPREEYDPARVDAMMEFLESMRQKMGIPELIEVSWWAGGPTEPTQPEPLEPVVLDLTQISSPAGDETVVMTVTTDYTGRVYLRDRSFSEYDGTTWRNPGKEGIYINTDCLDIRPYSLTVETEEPALQCYTPYYTDDALLEDGIALNEAGAEQYTYRFCSLNDTWARKWVQDNPSHRMYNSFNWHSGQIEAKNFTNLPKDQHKGIQAALMELDLTKESLELKAVAEVVRYVRSVADYAPDAAALPGDRQEFLAWFCQEAQGGYGTHYATAAAVMLQALGFRARIVTGYVADTQADVPLEVTRSMAHTWVEVCLDGAGWIMLEVCPGYAADPVLLRAADGLAALETPEETEPPTASNGDSNSNGDSYVNGDININSEGDSYGDGDINISGDRYVNGDMNGSGGGLAAVTNAKLDQAGPVEPDTQVLMRIQTDYQGYIYLRGKSYGDYIGTVWQTAQGQEVIGIDAAYLTRDTYRMAVENLVPAQLQYLPCYDKMPGSVLRDGVYDTQQVPTSYSMYFRTLRDQWQQGWTAAHSGLTVADVESPISQTGFTQLPDETLAAARQILDTLGITGDTPVMEAAAIIESYVQSSARYSLDTPYMPDDQRDFAIWFLRESDTGYCMHFASAAAVLLRAAGISARYTTGFLIQADSSEPFDVTDESAHAWVEFYLPDLGWVIMEATPSLSDVPAPPEDTQPQTEEPESTTQPENPTMPAEGDDLPARSGGWFKVLLAVLIFGGAVWLQWKLRMLWLRRRMDRSGSNARALWGWRRAQLLARLLEQEPPEALFELARKAKYSQYTITEAELQAFEAYFACCLGQIRTLPIHRRLAYRILFAIY